MSDIIDPDDLQDPRDAAAYWFARETSGRMDEAQRQRFEAWLQANPAHVLEYRRVKGVAVAARLIPADRLRALTQAPAPSGLARPRRRMALGLGAACAVAAVAGVGLSHYGLGSPVYAAEYRTARGERRQLVLPDDSIIVLNTATTVTVRYYEARRVVALRQGEAAFTVTPDVAKPFHVEAGTTSVRVTGTRFNVREDAGGARVAVASGAVEVSRGPWWDRRVVALRAGQGAGPTAEGDLTVAEHLDVASVMAWQQGRVVFRDTPLPQAIAEMNRYLAHPIRTGDARLDDVRIAGVFSTDGADAFLALLPDIAPVNVRRLADGAPVVFRR